MREVVSLHLRANVLIEWILTDFFICDRKKTIGKSWYEWLTCICTSWNKEIVETNGKLHAYYFNFGLWKWRRKDLSCWQQVSVAKNCCNSIHTKNFPACQQGFFRRCCQMPCQNQAIVFSTVLIYQENLIIEDNHPIWFVWVTFLTLLCLDIPSMRAQYAAFPRKSVSLTGK